MKYFYDTEFLEDGHTIELISLGMIAEDGREFYGINEFAPWDRIFRHDWLMANVMPSLPISLTAHHSEGKFKLAIDHDHEHVRAFADKPRIVNGLLDFIGDDKEVELWAYYGAYDHVVLCRLWGTMMDLPEGMPMWTHDLKQECERHGNPKLPKQPDGHHNALEDARWVKNSYEWLQQKD